MSDRTKIAPGKRFHTGQGLCQVITTAKYEPDGGTIVVYQELYGAYEVCARPLADLAAKKAGRASAKEPKKAKGSVVRVEPAAKEKAVSPEKKKVPPERGEVPAVLEEFLEAETYSEKLDILRDNRKYITGDILNSMATALDLVQNEGAVEEQYEELKKCLWTLEHYERSSRR